MVYQKIVNKSAPSPNTHVTSRSIFSPIYLPATDISPSFPIFSQFLSRPIVGGRFCFDHRRYPIFRRKKLIFQTLVVSNIQFGLGVPSFNKKSSPRMETQRAREEEKSSLVSSSDLSILEYPERAQPKDFRRWRIVKSKFEGSLYLTTFRVVSTVFGFGKLLYLEFLGTLYCG